MRESRPALRVGLAGLGAVGKQLATVLDRGDIPGMQLAAIAVRDEAKARASVSLTGSPVFTDVDQLASHCDVVVECAPAVLLPRIAAPALREGKTVLVLSAAALLSHMDLIELAREHGGQIIVPTGALLALDAVSAAAEGQIHSVRMVTRKPVRGLLGAKYLIDHNISIEGITEPKRIFKGTPREAAQGFDANLNVAVALSLAGIGPDRTELEVWADPDIERNMHRIEVEADSAAFSMEIRNVPSENPKTGRITALSVIAALRKLTAPLRVGT